MRNLDFLKARTAGNPAVRVGLVDGSVESSLSAFNSSHIEVVGGHDRPRCNDPEDLACIHGTFVAAILCSARDSGAPAICPGCTLLVRPIFTDRAAVDGADPDDLASAIIETVRAGAQIINISGAIHRLWTTSDLRDALDFAARSGVIVVTAAGNQGSVTSSLLTRHPAVLPVAACDRAGRPWPGSNLGLSIGRMGWSSYGDRVISLMPDGTLRARSGTSVATPLVTGALALLWSEHPELTAPDLRYRIRRALPVQTSIVPPVFDAEAAHRALQIRP